MKKLFIIFAAASILASCNNTTNSDGVPNHDSTAVIVDTSNCDTCVGSPDTIKVVK